MYSDDNGSVKNTYLRRDEVMTLTAWKQLINELPRELKTLIGSFIDQKVDPRITYRVDYSNGIFLSHHDVTRCEQQISLANRLTL